MPFLRLLAGFLALVVGLTVVDAETFTNPLVPQRADPWVYRHTDGFYYFIATVPAYDLIELRRATTIQGLSTAEPKVIWRKHESGPMSHHIWAPEIHFIDGKWYVYFAAGRAEAIWEIRMYALENAAANPFDGDWSEKGQIKTAWESFSLDATSFEHRGTRYLVWAQKDPAIRGNTNLYISAMENPWTLRGPQVMLSKPEYDWEQTGYWVNEGAAVIKKNGRIFMTYSGSATDRNYCMGLLTASEDADLLDPDSWAKSPVPVFSSNETTGQWGPGHNSFTTTADGTRDVLIYHARNYRDIPGNPLRNPDRHTRAQLLAWTEDGSPDFGAPVPDGTTADPERPSYSPAGKLAAKPLFRDPVYDGAADPVVIWNPTVKKWWMFYTNRRANLPGLSGVAWVHGTRVGIAESADGGATWAYIGTADIALPADVAGAQPTHWAPDVFTSSDGTHHMLLTVVPGVFETWQHPRTIVHLTSTDLRHWRNARPLALASDRVIDSSVFRLPDGTWRMWYNNERDRKSIYFADSPDLANWTDRGKAVGDQGGEGPKIFHWKDAYWMITDVWDGCAVYRSDDALNWTRQSGPNLLQQPGSGPDDRVKGGHPDVIVNDERAFLVYFTHPGRSDPRGPADGTEQRRSSIQLVELRHVDGRLTCDRDEPAYVQWSAPEGD